MSEGPIPALPAADDADRLLQVEVAYAAPEVEAVVLVRLPPGALLADAVAASGLVARLGLDPATLAWSIFGQRALPGTPLADGDRIELLRPLVADPKEARRQRAAARPLPRSRPRARRRPPNG